MMCKVCKRNRKVNESGLCYDCHVKIYLLAMSILEKVYSDPEWVQAFCENMEVSTEAVRRAMKILQGGNYAE